MNKPELMKAANEIRKGAVTGVFHAKSGHPGGSLSAADIYAYLFFEEMNIDPKDPKILLNTLAVDFKVLTTLRAIALKIVKNASPVKNDKKI